MIRKVQISHTVDLLGKYSGSTGLGSNCQLDHGEGEENEKVNQVEEEKQEFV